MKWLKVFALFVVIHSLAWVGAHLYKQSRPEQVLLVADTSNSLKSQIPDMQRWIEAFAADDRYRSVKVGTDKALIGDLDDIKSIDSIFRVSFGRSNANSLKRYDSEEADERIFLSDGNFAPSGWKLIKFPQN